MKIDKTYAIYFSPTATSKKSTISIARGLDGTLSEIDLTIKKNIQEMSFTRHDVVVFGFPVYGGRIPHVALERLKKMHGDHTSCIISVTYGNRDFDDALLELFNEVRALGFIPVGGAALIGQHTYGSVQVGRPDHQDLYSDELYGSLVREKLEKDNYTYVSVPGKYPYRQGGEGGSFQVETTNECIHCGLCQKMCPVNAIEDDCQTINDKCISCFRCLRLCPYHAKTMDNNEKYQDFEKMITKKLEEPKNNEYFI